jgi:hypothetical protein
VCHVIDLEQAAFPTRAQAGVFRRKCMVLINEVMTAWTQGGRPANQQFMYIELAKICGSSARPDVQHGLRDYIVVMMQYLLVSHEAPLTPGITFVANFITKELKPDPELIDGKQIFYFTIGQTNPNSTITKFSMRLDDQMVRSALSGTPKALYIIPPENETPTVIFLLKVDWKTDDPKIKRLQLIKDDTNHYPAAAFTLEKMEIVKSLMVDMFVYGKRINKNQARDLAFFSDVFAANPESVMFCSDAVKSQPTSSTSFSRCASNNYPMQMSSFKTSNPTPGTHNDCTQPVQLQYPYSFAGGGLQRTAQKLITNTVYSIKLSQAEPSILEGTPYEVASKILGISTRTITNINNRLDQGILLTPGKKRVIKCSVQVRIDSFDQEKIRKFIVDSYKRNIVPLVKAIYDLFMASKQEESAW